MGLFDSLFATSKKIDTTDQKKAWYLSQEAEDMYKTMSYVDRIDFITDYLLLNYYCEYVRRTPYYLFDFEQWKKTSSGHLKGVCIKLSHLFVLFIISSKNLPFSGYINALSRKVNPVLDTTIFSKNFKHSYKIDATKVIGSIHGKDNTSYSYADIMNNLSSVDNEDLYILERAIISLYSNNRFINYYYGVPKDI